MTALVPVIAPHILIRQSLITGAPVRDRLAIVWRNSEQEIVAVEAGYAQRRQNHDMALGFIVGAGIFWFVAIVLSLVAH